MARRGENIFKRKDGRWEARCIVSYESGKARYRYLYGKTYKEVKEKKRKAQLNLEVGGQKEAKRKEDFETLAEEWLAERRKEVKESTYTRYYRIVTKYLFPVLKNRELKSLTQANVTEVGVSLSEKGGVHGEPLSSKTVSDILCVLKSILQYGTEHHYPCPVISRIRCPKKSIQPRKVFTRESRLHLEQCLLKSEESVCTGIFLTMYTGIRIGELCGLRWGDIDFRNATLTISRTVERIADLSPGALQKTKVILSEPKTKSSVRVIPLPDFLLTYLKEHCSTPEYYLLTNSEHYTEPHQYYVRYRKFLEKHEIGEYSFHALRHTFATQCVELGFDTKSLSEILGHSNITTTLSIYVHPSLQQKKTQMERLTPENYL